MDDYDSGARQGRSYRRDTGVDDTAHDVARHTSDAEEIQARKEAGFNFSREVGTLPEHNARKEASPEELAIIAQMEAKQERKRQEALAAAATDIAIQRAHMEKREMEAEQAQRQAQVQEGIDAHQPQLEPIRKGNVLTAFMNGLKGMFTRRKAA